MATNLVTVALTNLVPVFFTDLVQAPVTNLVAKPEVEATIQAGGSIVNTFLPGIGSMIALALGGLYQGYRQVRNRKVKLIRRLCRHMSSEVLENRFRCRNSEVSVALQRLSDLLPYKRNHALIGSGPPRAKVRGRRC